MPLASVKSSAEKICFSAVETKVVGLQCKAVLGHLYSATMEQVGGKSEMELRRRNIGGDDIIRLVLHIYFVANLFIYSSVISFI